MGKIENGISWEDGIGFDFKRCRPGMAFLIKDENGEKSEGICYFVGFDPMYNNHYVFAKEDRTGYFSIKEKRLGSLLRFPPEDIVKWSDPSLDELDKKVCIKIGYVAGCVVTLVRSVFGGINKFIRKVF